MDSKIRKRALISIVIAFLGQMAVLLYLTKIYTEFNWQLITGSSLVVVGILILVNLFSVKKTIFKGKRILFYAVILNPCLVSVFSGVAIMTTENPRLEYIFIPFGIAMVLSFIAGFVTLIVALMRRNKEESD